VENLIGFVAIPLIKGRLKFFISLFVLKYLKYQGEEIIE
jgi:hypothetical protein